MPGEVWDSDNEFILNKRRICKYAAAFWMCISPVQVNNSLKSIEYSNDTKNSQKNDYVNENLNSVIANILNNLGRIMNQKEIEQIPLAMILTKSDVVDEGEQLVKEQRLFRPELSIDMISQRTKLEDTLFSDNKIKIEKFKNLENIVKKYIVTNRRIELENSFGIFKKKSYFAVAAVGRELKEENPECIPCIPSLVELPFLWLLANLGYIGLVKLKIKHRETTGFFSRIIQPRNDEPEFYEEDCDINELYIQ